MKRLIKPALFLLLVGFSALTNIVKVFQNFPDNYEGALALSMVLIICGSISFAILVVEWEDWRREVRMRKERENVDNEEINHL